MGPPAAPLKRGARGRPSPPGRVRGELAGRLTARRGEIEATLLTRIYSISDPVEVGDPEYVEGLRAAVSSALDYGLAIIEAKRYEHPPPIPLELLAQARLAARSRVSLDTVLRRYCGGNALFADAVIEEAECAGHPRSELKRLFRALASSFDHLLAVVGEEYRRESEARPKSSDRRRAELIERLLAGEFLDPTELTYNLDCWHIGLLGSGPRALESLKALAARLDRALLIVRAPG